MVMFDSYVNVYQRVQFISICDAKPYQQVNVAYTVLSTRALLKWGSLYLYTTLGVATFCYPLFEYNAIALHMVASELYSGWWPICLVDVYNIIQHYIYTCTCGACSFQTWTLINDPWSESSDRLHMLTAGRLRQSPVGYIEIAIGWQAALPWMMPLLISGSLVLGWGPLCDSKSSESCCEWWTHD